MQTKKRVLSLLLAAMMIFGMLPTMSFAASELPETELPVSETEEPAETEEPIRVAAKLHEAGSYVTAKGLSEGAALRVDELSLGDEAAQAFAEETELLRLWRLELPEGVLTGAVTLYFHGLQAVEGKLLYLADEAESYRVLSYSYDATTETLRFQAPGLGLYALALTEPASAVSSVMWMIPKVRSRSISNRTMPCM